MAHDINSALKWYVNDDNKEAKVSLTTPYPTRMRQRRAVCEESAQLLGLFVNNDW